MALLDNLVFYLNALKLTTAININDN